MPKPLLMLATLCSIAACASDPAAPDHTEDRKRRDAGAQTTDAGPTSTADASTTSSGSGTISCYTEGAPSNTCTLPVHCCFGNYTAQHDGYCTSDPCAWGTISCDGPEDCSGGGHCCSTELFDQDGISGYTIACQAAPCGTPPTGEELCHPGGPACANGGACVGAVGNNNDLPRTLDICR